MKYKGKGEHSVNQLESIIEILIEEKTDLNRDKHKALGMIETVIKWGSTKNDRFKFETSIELYEEFKQKIKQLKNEKTN